MKTKEVTEEPREKKKHFLIRTREYRMRRRDKQDEMIGSKVPIMTSNVVGEHVSVFNVREGQTCSEAREGRRRLERDNLTVGSRQFTGGRDLLNQTALIREEILHRTDRLRETILALAPHNPYTNNDIVRWNKTFSQCMKQFSLDHLCGAALTERLVCSPPSKANRVQSIPGRANPGSSQKGIVKDDAADWRIFSGISRFRRPFILALLHIYLSHPHRLSKPRCTVRPLAPHQGKPGSIPGRFTPGFSQVGITIPLVGAFSRGSSACVLVSPVSLPRLLTLDAQLQLTLNNEVLRANEGEMRRGWSSAGMQGRHQRHRPSRLPARDAAGDLTRFATAGVQQANR
ncbi:hypothetical protein PR048_031414 [Dryococelus australis]|uniref:Uncharacterized protein n=1 Tax=Dryococelus australis TaxID=614101 RepID=A0ABQ9G7X7_9NEOP|nr:hypothetical protein PR048_031414 [Dryococelus australis]